MEEITLMPKPAHQFPPHAKYIISSPVGEFPDLDVSLLVASWDQLDVMLKRDSTSGVIEETTFPIKVCLAGRDLLKRLFEQHQFDAKAIFSISTRSWHPPFTYTPVTSMPLDFTTYSEDDHYVTIDGVNAELNAYINSFGKNKYDIPAADVVEDTRWEYQRMEMLNRGVWVPVPGGVAQSDRPYDRIARLPIYLNTSQTEMTPGSIGNDMKDQTRGDDLDDYFFKAAGNIDVLTIRAKFRLDHWGLTQGEWNLELHRINNENGTSAVVKSWPGLSSGGGRTLNVDETIVINNVVADDSFTLVVNKHTGNFPYRIGFIDEEREFTVSYYASAPALTGNDAIPVIDPQRLMQKYLDLMAPGRFTCEIEWKDEPHPIKLVAGESLRNYPLTGNEDQIAYLHGSPNDFIDFMRVLGYEQGIEGSVVRFKRRDEFFRRDISAARLNEREVSEFKIIANQAHANTKIRIGCEKQDYDSINGRFEGNFVHEYTTGHINIEDQELDLISPYRTDPIGIELTTWERKNIYTDKKADNDIFAVVLKRDGDRYIEVTDVYMEENVASIDRIKMFNATLNPFYLIKRNESLIGIISKEVRFTATEGSKSIIIRSSGAAINPRQNIPITKKLHDPVMYDFKVGFLRNLPTPDTRMGLVYIPYRGKTYKGFISDIRKNHGHETEETWGLWAVMD